MSGWPSWAQQNITLCSVSGALYDHLVQKSCCPQYESVSIYSRTASLQSGGKWLEVASNTTHRVEGECRFIGKAPYMLHPGQGLCMCKSLLVYVFVCLGIHLRCNMIGCPHAICLLRLFIGVAFQCMGMFIFTPYE